MTKNSLVPGIFFNELCDCHSLHKVDCAGFHEMKEEAIASWPSVIKLL